jgi:hypothetical protein
MNTFLSTLDLMAAMKTFIASIDLSPAIPAEPPDEPTPAVKLFDAVHPYATPNLLQALEDLLEFDDRVCLIIPSGDDFSERRNGRLIEISCVREFELLIADRDYGDRQAAATGSDDAPGVIRMKDLLVEKMLGEDLGFAPRLARSRPAAGQPLLLQGKERDALAGRNAWQMTWRLDAGEMIR